VQISKITHGLLQLVALVAQYANVASGAIPAKFQPLVAGVVALAQGILAVSQHSTTASK
jgi:hypothetical protein